MSSQLLENRLTPENKELVRRYIMNCNDETIGFILLGAFEDNTGKPISNAFYLHELTELESFKEEGHDFVNVQTNEEFRAMRAKIYDENRKPHLQATEMHCRYFQQKAREVGYDLSLGTVIEYDPISSRRDKDDLFANNPSLKVVESEKDKAEKFFASLIRAEKSLLYQPFNMGSIDRYR